LGHTVHKTVIFPSSELLAYQSSDIVMTEVEVVKVRKSRHLVRNLSGQVVVGKPDSRDVPFTVGLHSVPLVERPIAAPVVAAGPTFAAGMLVQRLECR